MKKLSMRSRYRLGCLSVIIFVLSCLLTPFVLLLSEEIYTNDLDNMYIDNSFEGWECITLTEESSISIPRHWNIEGSSDNGYIFSIDGEVIAYCCVLDADLDSQGLITQMIEDPIQKIERTYFPDTFSMAYSEFCRLDIFSNEKQIGVYQLFLSQTQEERIICLFPLDKWKDYDEVYEIAEAIMYSFHFDVVPHT